MNRTDELGALTTEFACEELVPRIEGYKIYKNKYGLAIDINIGRSSLTWLEYARSQQGRPKIYSAVARARAAISASYLALS